MVEKKKIDFEKAQLVIFRNKEGAFNSFQWFERDAAEVSQKVEEYNKRLANINVPYAELITDSVVREVCAYRQKAAPYEALKGAMRRLDGTIDEAVRHLRNAIDNLESVRIMP
jgi:GTP1/Obg family GTP-binding protein